MKSYFSGGENRRTHKMFAGRSKQTRLLEKTNKRRAKEIKFSCYIRMTLKHLPTYVIKYTKYLLYISISVFKKNYILKNFTQSQNLQEFKTLQKMSEI